MTEEERGEDQKPDRKEKWLRGLEFLWLYFFMATHRLMEYHGAPRWLGIVLTVLFGVAFGLLNFRRQTYSRRGLLAELIGGTLLFGFYIYLVFFRFWA